MIQSVSLVLAHTHCASKVRKVGGVDHLLGVRPTARYSSGVSRGRLQPARGVGGPLGNLGACMT